MGIIHTLLLSCKKAVALLDQGTVVPLSPIERLQLRVHMGICKGCGAYKHQSELIDHLLENRSRAEAFDTKALEERINLRLPG